MTIRFFTPIPWAMGLVLVCAEASADVSQPPEAEARLARVQASASVWSMESAARRARVILQKARRRGDAREVGCADETLSRVDMALRAGRGLVPGEVSALGPVFALGICSPRNTAPTPSNSASAWLLPC